MKKYTFLIIILLLVLSDSGTDVLFYRGLKFESKVLENLYKLGLVITILRFVKIDWQIIFFMIFTYFGIHLVFFDLSFNLFAGLDLGFVGTSSGIYDAISKNFGIIWSYFFKLLICGIAIFFYLRIFKWNSQVGP